MMVTWMEFIKALDQDECGDIVRELFGRIEESPIVSEIPDSYNDPQGKTKFYKFIMSGLEFGFRADKLNHIHFFVQNHEGYSAYKGDILGRMAQAWSNQEIVKVLGLASRCGEGRHDMLIGYLHQWMKYECGAYAMRMEFAKDGCLWKATLMSN